MNLYSELMDLQETIEFLEVKTESKLDKERVLKIIEQNNLPIVFEYEGWAVWETCQANRPLQMELKGYFKHINNATMIQAYTGFLKELVIYEAEIHGLDYCKIRNKNDAPERCKPRVGDLISFVNGGRSPLFSSTSQGYVVIKNSNIGVLRSELEKLLSKSKLSYEELQARISELEAENSQLKEQIALRKPSEDKELTYKSQMAVARLVYTLLAVLEYDISSHKGKTNDLIVNASNLQGTPVTKGFVSQWLKLASQAKSDSTK